MAENTLTNKTNSQTIDQTWFNDIHTALAESFVGRDTDGVPTSGKDLGSSLYPWGKAYISDLVIDGALIDITSVIATQSHKIISGKVGADSNQAMFLTPAGSSGGRSLTISASVTSLIYEVTGEQTTLSSNIVVSGLTAAPSSNNTATINDSHADNSNIRSAKIGERLNHDDNDDFTLTISSAGSNITALVGQRACFKYVGGITQYFTAYVQSSTVLSDIQRGFFFNSSLAPFKRGAMNNGGTITLMKLGWLFLDIDGATTEAVYTEPVFNGTQPASPASGDYWYDSTNSLWKRYNGSAFIQVDRLLIGMFFCDTADCLGVRAVDYFATHKADNSIEIQYFSATQVLAKGNRQKICVFGNTYDFANTRLVWDITTNLAPASLLEASTSEAASLYYFAYITDRGVLKLSDAAPIWRGQFFGWYHPFAPWRAVGYIYNNSSSDFSAGTVITDNLGYGNLPVSGCGYLTKTNFLVGGLPRNRLEPLDVSTSAAFSGQSTTGTSFVSIVSTTTQLTRTGTILIIITGTSYASPAYIQSSGFVSNRINLVLKQNGTKVMNWPFLFSTTTQVPLSFVTICSATKYSSNTFELGLESESGTQIANAGDARMYIFDIEGE